MDKEELYLGILFFLPITEPKLKYVALSAAPSLSSAALPPTFLHLLYSFCALHRHFFPSWLTLQDIEDEDFY